MQRIQVNGIWYIKEEEKKPELELDNIFYSKTCLYETNDYSWQAEMMLNYQGDRLYKDAGFFINFKNKKEDIEEIWDNDSWILGVYYNQKDPLIEAADSMDEDGIETFKEFIGHLIKIGWLKK